MAQAAISSIHLHGVKSDKELKSHQQRRVIQHLIVIKNKRTMTKIAIPTKDNVVDNHFGHCDGSIADSAESCSHHDCGEHEDKPVFIIPDMW